ncbi:alpha/beta fold hydrolase [Actinotalea sp. Marseille-Q4924]|uniref:alpha/beta fold hydrolase n=1 Tax=Actinotalea sp. Marseille-Q4924 TaxID=2866571 RepID=UPI001CE49144|nr:alpha/beta fold hydrolase [Actinotalea sp. Marseille-Q4924]
MTVQGHRVRAGEQELRFSRAADGTRLAWSTHGAGPPLVLASCWMSHLQHDWHSPVWRHFLDALGAVATTIRYDERGFGLSDWDVTDFSLQARLGDLETLLDAVPYQRVALMGMSAGAPVAIAYAALHPERVSRLVLYAPIGSGCFAASDDAEAEAALMAIISAGWGRKDPLFRRVFTSMLIPEATEEQMGWLDEQQRVSTSTHNAMASRVARATVDVTPYLPLVQAPTLVLHARGDRAAPFDRGLRLARAIPEARLVPLESRNHILLGDEPAWRVFHDEVVDFLAPDRDELVPPPEAALALSAREREVLALAAHGDTNETIAAALHLSVRTVERHLQNVYLKAGVSGRTARTAAVVRYLSRS